MSWLDTFELFLFDFDGLLVNTEEIHFAAYREVVLSHGFHLDWDFARYCRAAHHDATGLRDAIYAELPGLQRQMPDWDELYQQKQSAFLRLAGGGQVRLMPGVDLVLHRLSAAKVKTCVVTHSPDPLVAAIKAQHPILTTLGAWITREHYRQPKPDPECYRVAIERFAAPGSRVIGFEDTPRGLKALMGTKAQPVLVCPRSHPGVGDYPAEQVWHHEGFNDILKAGFLG